MSLPPPVKLEKRHELAGFRSGAEDLDTWIQRFAWMNQAAGNATTYVATDDDDVVIGYYALATAAVAKADAPGRIQQGGVPPDIPCLLLARLAVTEDWQGRGLGRGLLIDALQRTVQVASEVGVRALLIHARDEHARAFYLRHADFLQSPTDDLHLLLLIKDARKVLAP
jgi:GNAT superfamily N-acetyltransferase